MEPSKKPITESHLNLPWPHNNPVQTRGPFRSRGKSWERESVSVSLTDLTGMGKGLTAHQQGSLII